jgi:hypothetical protein
MAIKHGGCGTGSMLAGTTAKGRFLPSWRNQFGVDVRREERGWSDREAAEDQIEQRVGVNGCWKIFGPTSVEATQPSSPLYVHLHVHRLLYCPRLRHTTTSPSALDGANFTDIPCLLIEADDYMARLGCASPSALCLFGQPTGTPTACKRAEMKLNPEFRIH